MQHCARRVVSLFYVTVMTLHEGETLGLSILRSEFLRIDPNLNPIFVLSKIMLKDFTLQCRGCGFDPWSVS